MSALDDGGPAFPACNEANVNDTMGMSLRDWFAGQVLAGIAEYSCSTPMADANDPDKHAANIARLSYALADAMLAHRDTRKGDEDGR